MHEAAQHHYHAHGGIRKEKVMESRRIYCAGDSTYHYADEVPPSLRSFVDYQFSSGGVIGEDFRSFNTKYRNAIKTRLPKGYLILNWTRGHYFCSWVIKTPDNKYIHMCISDVRFFQNEWFSNILMRTMRHPKDWTGGPNRFTTLFTMKEDIQKLWR